MKKIMTILAALAVALMLVGCAALGKGFTSGTKWKKKMTVDGTNINYTFRRFIKPLSSSRRVSEIKTTIAVDKSTVLKSSASGQERNAVVGLAIDFHEQGVGNSKKYDFVLIGICPDKETPAASQFYIERYVDVAKAKAETADIDIADDEEDLGSKGFDTDDKAMGSYYTFGTGTFPLSIKDGEGNLKSPTDTVLDWNTVPNGSYNFNGENGFEFYVKVEQSADGKYEIYLGNTKVATYDSKTKVNQQSVGGAAVYANAPKGTKVIAKYISDKTATVGLFADEEEF